MENEVARASARVADIVAAAERAADELYAQAEKRMRERIAEGDEVPVNSRHHQAIKQAGQDLLVSGTAPDGVIEAVEDATQRFCLGVQWHPENFYRTGEFSPLFEGFVKAAAR